MMDLRDALSPGKLVELRFCIPVILLLLLVLLLLLLLLLLILPT